MVRVNETAVASVKINIEERSTIWELYQNEKQARDVPAKDGVTVPPSHQHLTIVPSAIASSYLIMPVLPVELTMAGKSSRWKGREEEPANFFLLNERYPPPFSPKPRTGSLLNIIEFLQRRESN